MSTSIFVDTAATTPKLGLGAEGASPGAAATDESPLADFFSRTGDPETRFSEELEIGNSDLPPTLPIFFSDDTPFLSTTTFSTRPTETPTETPGTADAKPTIPLDETPATEASSDGTLTGGATATPTTGTGTLPSTFTPLLSAGNGRLVSRSASFTGATTIPAALAGLGAILD
jgi:hypothetical protein